MIPAWDSTVINSSTEHVLAGSITKRVQLAVNVPPADCRGAGYTPEFAKPNLDSSSRLDRKLYAYITWEDINISRDVKACLIPQEMMALTSEAVTLRCIFIFSVLSGTTAQTKEQI